MNIRNRSYKLTFIKKNVAGYWSVNVTTILIKGTFSDRTKIKFHSTRDFKSEMYFQTNFFESLEMKGQMCSRLQFDLFGANMNQQSVKAQYEILVITGLW